MTCTIIGLWRCQRWRFFFLLFLPWTILGQWGHKLQWNSNLEISMGNYYKYNRNNQLHIGFGTHPWINFPIYIFLCSAILLPRNFGIEALRFDNSLVSPSCGIYGLLHSRQFWLFCVFGVGVSRADFPNFRQSHIIWNLSTLISNGIFFFLNLYHREIVFVTYLHACWHEIDSRWL